MAALRAMASSCSCIACGESKEEADTFCKCCSAAFIEIATEADSFCAPCDSPEIDIATAEKRIPGSKRKLCPTESCAVCGLYLGATPATPYCSVCESVMIDIASPEAATNSVPPPVCGSTRRRLRFDAAMGGVTIDLSSPKTPNRLASSLIRNQKEIIPDLDDGNLIEQSQESTPGSVCKVMDVLTAEAVISQRFVEAEQNGEIVNLLSQEEFESSRELQ
jgi:hypothetical protein